MIEKKGEKQETIGKTEAGSIIMGSPWKKIIWVGVIIILAVMAMEFIGIYLEDKDIPFLHTAYFLYSWISVVGVIIAVLIIWFIIKRRKSEKIMKRN